MVYDKNWDKFKKKIYGDSDISKIIESLPDDFMSMYFEEFRIVFLYIMERFQTPLCIFKWQEYPFHFAFLSPCYDNYFQLLILTQKRLYFKNLLKRVSMNISTAAYSTR